MGRPNEAEIQLEGVPTTALLDTGSAISTVSEEFFKVHLKHLQLHSIDGLLKVECANGQPLPYLGYIKTDVIATGLEDTTYPCLLLVVPGTSYNASTPVLLGTNFLCKVKENCDQHDYMRRVNKHTAWQLAVKSITLQDKQLTKNCNRIAVVRSAERDRMIVHPNEQVTVRGYIDRAQPYHKTCALLQPHTDTDCLLDLTPSLISYAYRETEPVQVTFSNVTTHTVTLNPKTVLCEVQPVTITELDDLPEEVRQNLFSQIDIDSEHLSAEQQEEVQNLVSEYHDIFSKHDEDVGLTSRVRHRIDLSEELLFVYVAGS